REKAERGKGKKRFKKRRKERKGPFVRRPQALVGGGRGRRQVTGSGAGRTARGGGGEAAAASWRRARGDSPSSCPPPPPGETPPWKIKSVKVAVLGFPGSGAAPARVWRCRSSRRLRGTSGPTAASKRLPPTAMSQRGGSGAPPRGQRAPWGKGPEQIPRWGCAVPRSRSGSRSFSPLREQTRKGSGVFVLRGEPAVAGPV
ncbi:hypothetical protein Nmel_001176, partial [Mimus melanotis]